MFAKPSAHGLSPTAHRHSQLGKREIIRIFGNFRTRVCFYRRPRFDRGTTYRAGEAGAQATAQSERTRPRLVANRFRAISQVSMISARLVKTELASQWLRK